MGGIPVSGGMLRLSLLSATLLGTGLTVGTVTAADELDTIIIDGGPSPLTGDVDPDDYAGNLQRIDVRRHRLANTALADVLAKQTGVQSRRIGGFGSYSAITLRAGTPAQTGLYLDGTRLNSGGHAAIDLSTLELLNLDTIAIYRGAVPAQLGYASIGGAVDLLTPRLGTNEPATRWLVGAGSFGSSRTQFAHQSRQSGWELVGMASAQQSDNDFRFTDRNGTPLNSADDRRETRHNAAATRISALAKLAAGTSAQGRTDILMQAQRRKLGVPEWRNAVDNDARYDTDSVQLQASYRRDRLGAWDVRQSAFAHHNLETFADPEAAVGLAPTDSETRTLTTGGNVYGERVLGEGLLALSTEVRRETLDAEDRLNPSDAHDAERLAAAVTLSWGWLSADDRWLITPSVFWQGNRDAYRRDSAGEPVRQTDSAIGPQLALRFDASDTVALLASIGEYYRAPSFGELFGNQGLLTGNSNLQPERGSNGEIGLRWQARPDLKFESSLFFSRRSELITTVYDARGIGRHINAGGADIVGLELQANWRWRKHWLLEFNLTAQDARADTADRVIDGRQLPGEARLTSFARLQREFTARWLGWLESESTTDRYYDQANVLPARDQWLTHVGLEYTRNRWQAGFTITNLSDGEVEDFNGFPRPGRAFTLNVTLQL